MIRGTSNKYLTLSLHSQANIDKAVADCDKVKAVHKQLSDEKNELNLALQSGLNSFESNPPKKHCSHDFSVTLSHHQVDLPFRISSTKPTGWREI